MPLAADVGSISGQWARTIIRPTPPCTLSTFGGLDHFNPRIPSYSYLDLAATWHFRESLTLRAGINNVLDKDPPLLSTTIVPPGEANTIDVYDLFGRQLYWLPC
ncbi:MAG TPA: hypothetical protein VGO37_01955 [Steroidobacteraceae bacterium]|nr:hypothetical protein [Steroidobacteraceae bacterium]